jgi:hypothetical protein
MRSVRGFSLIEVVFCLGLVTFCVVALLGLFAVGFNQSRDSGQSIRAAHLMSEMIANRVASPKDSSISPLPVLNKAGNTFSEQDSPIYITASGAKESKDKADFQVNYRVLLPSAAEQNTVLSNVVRVSLVISWPAGAQLKNASGMYEITFCEPLPN